jgi:hypothetical protein
MFTNLRQHDGRRILSVVLGGFLLCTAIAVSSAPPAPAFPLRWNSGHQEVRLDPATGRYEIQERDAGHVWKSNPLQVRFGEVVLRQGNETETVPLAQCMAKAASRQLELTFHPSLKQPQAWIKVILTSQPDPHSIQITYVTSPGLQVDNIRLWDQAGWTADGESGYAVVPVREGLLIPAQSGKSFSHRFDTYSYEGCHMAMAGVVAGPAALLMTWDDPNTALELNSVLHPAQLPGMGQVLLPSLVLSKSARTLTLTFCTKGDYVFLARQYRQLARQKGWWVSWDKKRAQNPELVKLEGALNFKLWSVLSRQMNDESTKEERVSLHWTFDEAAQVAEHLKNELKLDRVLFTIGGWIHRGYDNQHPDILPAAPECGGDEALAQCSRRVQELGYVFCLHDNYQDIYRDSPSWGEEWIMRNRDGNLVQGGKWAGGRAYLTCSQKAFQLAQRPQNLPAVYSLTHANSYFIDTTYAAGLQECFDPHHPLTRADDMHWKQALSDYGRQQFGIFGSECGREWAIPHSDFFEGLTGVSGQGFHDTKLLDKLGASIIPWFELVYHDTMAMYGKYGYDINKSTEYVLQHMIYGRPLNIHQVPSHLYWRTENRREIPATDQGLFVRGDSGWTEGMHPLDRFVKNTQEILGPLSALTASLPMTSHQFLDANRTAQHAQFGEGKSSVQVVVNRRDTDLKWSSRFGGQIILPRFGFLIEAPGFAAFNVKAWNGINYSSPVLFTLTSLDGKPLSRSNKIRIFHGFGSPNLCWRGKTLAVQKETVWPEPKR